MSSGSYFRRWAGGERLRYRRIMGPGSGFSVCRMWQTGWLRPRQRCCWKRSLSRIFHPDSYGYRPGRSAHDALAVARKRCWNKDWVLDLDVGAFFDSVPHDLLMKAVAHHTDERWVLLYIERWLKAPMTMTRRNHTRRERGEPHKDLRSRRCSRTSFHALCVRQVDGPRTLRLCVRALRG